MTNPAPFHITAIPQRVRVLFEGHELADSGDVLVLKETGYDPVYYFPKADVEMATLRATDHTTRCPWKGIASYYTIMRDGKVIENIAWCYETPVDEAEAIEGRLAFDARHVDFQVDDTPQASIPHVSPHDPPYADDLDTRDSRTIPSTPSPRTPG